MNIPSKTLEFWIAADAPDIEARVRSRWPEWTIDWHQDQFESQLECTRGRLGFPKPSRQLLENRLQEILLSDLGGMPKCLLLQIAADKVSKGEEVRINPYAFREDRLELAIEARREILDSVVQAAQ